MKCMMLLANSDDIEWVKRLETTWSPVKHLLKPWTPNEIAPGQVEKKIIQQTLGKAWCIVPLITAGFLADTEMMLVVDKAREKSLPICWIYVGPCLWRHTLLKDFQPINTGKSLSDLNEPECGSELINIVERLLDVLPSNMKAEPQEPSTTAPSAQCECKLVLSGDINEMDQEKRITITCRLKLYSEDPHLIIEKIEAGSLILTLAGSLQGFQRLNQRIQTGELVKVAGHRILSLSMIKGGTLDHPVTSVPRKTVVPAPRKTTAKKMVFIDFSTRCHCHNCERFFIIPIKNEDYDEENNCALVIKACSHCHSLNKVDVNPKALAASLVKRGSEELEDVEAPMHEIPKRKWMLGSFAGEAVEEDT